MNEERTKSRRDTRGWLTVCKAKGLIVYFSRGVSGGAKKRDEESTHTQVVCWGEGRTDSHTHGRGGRRATRNGGDLYFFFSNQGIEA